MDYFITIDGGTTNTRIAMVKNDEIKSVIKLPIGARAAIDGGDELKKAISSGIKTVLEQNSVNECDVECIIVSGMLTSEFGLVKLDHITTPAGIKELKSSLYHTTLKDISAIPFVFVRGVRTGCENLECADMMRGEETELMGIMESGAGNCAYVLPGSHSKIIFTDNEGRIDKFSTMLTGEMIASLSQNTILKDAVNLSVSQTDDEYLIKGYEYCEKRGINETLFKVRILKNIFGCSPEQIYSFFMGAVLSDEIKIISESKAEKIIIGGKAEIKNIIAKLMKHVSSKEVIMLDEKTVNESTVNGALKIYLSDR